MKEQDIHSVLWQKRNELRIADDVQHDWLDMQAVLDAQMPVGNPPIGDGGLSGLSGFKLLSVLLATLAAATLIYFASHKGVTEKNDKKKNTTAIAVTNKNDRSVNSSNTNNRDSLSAATPSSGLNSTTPAAINPDKTTSGTPSASSVNTANSNTAINSSTPGNKKAANIKSATASAVLSANKPNINTNNPVVKASSGAVKDNKNAESAPVSLPGNKTIANTNSHPVKGNSTAAKGNKLVNNVNKRTTAGSSSLNRIPHNDVKTTGPAARLGRSGAGIFRHSGGTGNTAISGSGLIRNGRNRSPRTVSGSANNTLSKLKGSHSSRKGKNNPLTGNGTPAGNAPNQYTGINANPGSNPTPPVKNNTDQSTDLAEAIQAKFIQEKYVPATLSAVLANQFKDAQNTNQPVKNPDNKTANNKNPKLDWGILAGVNTAGSFTAKSQNANFYGSFPVDAFFGLFATYHFSDKWGVNLGIRGLNPQTLSGSYTHKNDSKLDTLQTLNISDSRKVYFVDVPLNLVFKANQYLSLKSGPVFSLPLKQVNGSSTFQTGKLKKDSLYYVGVTKTINATNYTQSLNVGLSFGASAQAGRFIFDAAYIRGLKGLTVSSGLGSYTANSNEFLFTIGFKLNRLKK